MSGVRGEADPVIYPKIATSSFFCCVFFLAGAAKAAPASAQEHQDARHAHFGLGTKIHVHLLGLPAKHVPVPAPTASRTCSRTCPHPFAPPHPTVGGP